MSEPVTDMLATAIVEFQIESSSFVQANAEAKSTFERALETSDLLGAGGVGIVRYLERRIGSQFAYAVSAVALFRVLVSDGDDAMKVASERLAAEIEDSPIFSSGAVCTVEDD